MGPILGIVGGAMGLAGPWMIGFVPIWLGVTYATARYVYRRATRRRARELEGLADRLAGVIAEIVDVPQRLQP